MSKLGTGKYLAASYIGYATYCSDVVGIGTGVLGATAYFGSDEFYDQAQYVHTLTSNIAGSMLIGTGILAATGILLTPHDVLAQLGLSNMIAKTWGTGIVSGIGTILAGNIIVPAITSEIHEYTHPHNDYVTLTGHSNDYDSIEIA
ncbi:MAG: hypothetical protein ACK4OM_05280 [Alphaproteobacteria bacterium]